MVKLKVRKYDGFFNRLSVSGYLASWPSPSERTQRKVSFTGLLASVLDTMNIHNRHVEKINLLS